MEFTIATDVIDQVLLSAIGPEARRVSHVMHLHSFPYLNTLTVQVQNGEEKFEKKFLVQKADCIDDDTMRPYCRRAFSKNAFFHETMGPLLNEKLESIGEEPLIIAKCHYSSSELDKEIAVYDDIESLHDLRSAPERWLLDEAHVYAVVKELAKLHVSSLLLQEELETPLDTKFSLLKESWTVNKVYRDAFRTCLCQSIDLVTDILDSQCAHNEKTRFRNWLKEVGTVSTNPLLLVMNQLYSSHNKFEALTHGDLQAPCMLFKYDSKGKPVRMAFIDFLCVRMAPVSTDITRLLYYTLLPIYLDENALHRILYIYYTKYTDIINELPLRKEKFPQTQVAFTKAELISEVERNKFGTFSLLILLPISLLSQERLNRPKEGTRLTRDQTDVLETHKSFCAMIKDQLKSWINRIVDEKVHETYSNIEQNLWVEPQ